MLPAALVPMLAARSGAPYPFTTVQSLFGGPFVDLADFQALVARFNFLILNPDQMTDATVEYLTSEGGLVESDGALDYHHRDFWLNKILRENLEITGRLPWGEDNPEDIDEADPLGLMKVAGTSSVRADAIIVDPQGSNTSTTNTSGAVRIKYGENNCTTTNGVDKTPAGLWSTTGETYRYQFWTRLENLHETGGASTVRFLDAPTGVADKTVTVYVRYANDHQLSKELVWRKRTNQSDPKQIIIRGYPGERPVIRMGNSTDDDANPTVVGTASGSVRPAMITIGQSVANSRLNVHFRNIDFVGNRDGDGSDLIFASKLIEYGGATNEVQTLSMSGPPTSGTFTITFDGQTTAAIAYNAPTNSGAGNVQAALEALSNIGDNNVTCTGGPLPGIAVTITFRGRFAGRDVPLAVANNGGLSGGTAAIALTTQGGVPSASGSIRYCVFTETQFMRPDDPLAGSNPGLVDAVWALRGKGGRITSSASSGGGSPKVVFTLPSSGHGIEVDDQFNVIGHSVSGYNTLHTVTAVSGATVTTDIAWTANGNGGQWLYAEDSVDKVASALAHSGGVASRAHGFVFDSNYVCPVTLEDWPGNNVENYSSFASVWLDIKADDVRITRNTFAGVKVNSMLRLGDGDSETDGAYIADNDMEVYDKKCIDVFNSSNFTIERNRCHDFALVNYEFENGGNGISVQFSRDGVVQYNVVYNHEPAVSGANGIDIGNSSNVSKGSDNIVLRRNFVYRCGVRWDTNGPFDIENSSIEENLIAGMTEARKGTFHTNAPIHVEMDLSVGTLEGNTVTGNQIWRFEDFTPDQETIESGPHLSIRTNTGANQYEVDDTLTGFTDNLAEKPAWAGEPEDDDFTLDQDEIGFPEDMPFTHAQSKAWTPD